MDIKRTLCKLMAAAMCVFALMLFFAWMLSSCQSQRRSAVSAAVVQTQQRSDSISRNVGFETARQWMMMQTVSADSVAVVFAADSVVSADGTRYVSPRVTRRIYTPRREMATVAADTTVVTASEQSAHNAADSVAGSVIATMQQQTTAIAKPPDLTAIVAIVIVAVLVVTVVVVGYKNRRDD